MSGARQPINYYIYPGTNTTTDFDVKRNWDYDITAGIRGNASAQESAQGIDGRVRMTTSNCYMVSPGSTFTIPVDVKGDANGPLSSDYLTALGISDTSLSPSSVSLLWEDTDGLISNVSDIYNGKVNITLSSSSGNAVIAAYDTNGTTILWSWHIWATDYNPDDGGTTYAYNNETYTTTFMDRNLGATVVATSMTGPLSSYGLYYQWGRKDPFPSANATTLTYGVSGITNSATMYGTKTSITITSGPISMAASIQNPTVFYTAISSPYDWNSSPNVNLWGNPTESMVNAKSPYDPCPLGWRVPVWEDGVSPWSGIDTYSSLTSSLGYYPASGSRNYGNGVFCNVGSLGYSWVAPPYGLYGRSMYLNSSNVYPSNGHYRAYGFGVRCCRE